MMNRPYSGTFGGKHIIARSDVVFFNEESGNMTELSGEGQARRLYLQLARQPRFSDHRRHILRWSNGNWMTIVPGSVQENNDTIPRSTMSGYSEVISCCSEPELLMESA